MKLEFRMLAVHRVTTNKGHGTPGVDKKLLITNEEKWGAVEWLRYTLQNHQNYKASPVRRVYIPKPNGKKRPLGIPTIEDRCLQALVNLVLEPLVEMRSDRHSYGFRRYRNAKMAIGALRIYLRSKEYNYDRYALDADIKGYFDNISHQWLLNNAPLEINLMTILDKWLKAGSIFKDEFTANDESGTPQGGIISPSLANLTLNGLEEWVETSVRKAYNVKQRGIYVRKYNQTTWLKTGLCTVRFADDFVILARSKRMIEEVIRPSVDEFLKERGVWLSEDKTKILSIRGGDKLDFLGYTFQYFEKIRSKYKLFHDRQEMEGIACYPQKDKYKNLVRKIRDIFRAGNNLTSYSLIAKLNPIIRGWANYFNMGQSFKDRTRLNYRLFRFSWDWAKKKHPRWGRIKIARTYYLKPRNKNSENKAISSTTGNSNKWIFRGITRNNSIYNDSKGGKSIELVNPTQVVTTMSPKRYRIPKELELVHAYHSDFKRVIDFNAMVSLENLKANPTTKVKLLIKQKGLCNMCGMTLLNESGEFEHDGTTNIHHEETRSRGGSKSNINNLKLVHSKCHVEHHR